MSELTQILSRIDAGDLAASDELLPMVYHELRNLARVAFANERPGQTLQATALVHEAYLRLADRDDPQRWQNSRHFFAAAAESMRRILIERARQRASFKRGGGRQRIALQAADEPVLPLACDDLLGLDEALTKLSQLHPRKAELVKLRFFAGLTVTQAAAALEISTTTAENDWAFARSWLRVEMSGESRS